MKIRTRLLILMFSLVGVSLLLSALLSYQFNASFIQESNIKIQKGKTYQAISLMDSFLSLHKQRVKDLSEQLSVLISVEKIDPQKSLELFLTSNVIYRETALVDQTGREIARVARHPVYGPEEMRDFSQNKFFLKTLTGKPCWYQGAIRNEFGEPRVNLYCPVYDESKKVSQVLIHNILSSISLGETGHIFVADTRGFVIAHPDFSNVLNQMNILDLPIFNRLLQIESSPQKTEVLNVESGDAFFFGGISQELSWFVIVKQATLEANTALGVLARVEILVMGILLIIGSFLIVFFSKRITAPIRALSYGINSAAKGDLNFLVQVQSDDEFGEMSRGLNEMAENLMKTTVSRDYVDNIISSMLNMLIVLTPKGEIKMANKATYDLMGYTEDALIGQPAEIMIQGGDFSQLEGSEEGGVCHIESIQRRERVYLTKAGEMIPVLFSASVMHGGDGSIEGIVCMVQDISELKKAEFELKAFADRLSESNKELVEFARVASHDLQEPLGKVTAFGDRLKNKWRDVLGEQGGDYLDRMRNALFACKS